MTYSAEQAESMARLLDAVEAKARGWAATPHGMEASIAEMGEEILDLLDHD